MEKEPAGECRDFMTGNEVIARAALAAGADFMFGYPITPQNEIMHHWRRLAPQQGRGFLQTEDELSAGFAAIGAIISGKAAFSATAGPGTVLFQEPLSMAEMMRLPVVVAVQQRGGPSTATVIYSQQELTLICFGGNGGSGWSTQQAAIRSFTTIRSKLFTKPGATASPPSSSATATRPRCAKRCSSTIPCGGIGDIPKEAIFGSVRAGDGPLLHLRNSFSVEEELSEVLERHLADYARAAPALVEHEFIGVPGGELLVVAHGIVGRAARQAVQELRGMGRPINFFRPITLRPFPEDALREALQMSGGAVLVAESAQGQLGNLVRLAASGEGLPDFRSYYRPGVGITAEEIKEAVLDERALDAAVLAPGE